MTLTTSQLDELDMQALAALNGLPSAREALAESANEILHLVAIARAALSYVTSTDEDRVAEFDALVAALGAAP